MVLKSEYNKRVFIRGLDIIYGGKIKVHVFHLYFHFIQ